MGKQTVVKITDDHDGQELSPGQAYEVTLTLRVKPPLGVEEERTAETWDLVFSAANRTGLRDAIKPYIGEVPATAPATKASGGGGQGSTRVAHARAWWANLTDGQRMDAGKLPEAKKNGRIPAEVYAAYDAAKPDGHVPE
jgi:Lsr2